MGTVDSKHYIEIKTFDIYTRKETHSERIPADSETHARELYENAVQIELLKPMRKVSLVIDWREVDRLYNFIHRKKEVVVLKNNDLDKLIEAVNLLEESGQGKLIGGISSYIEDTDVINAPSKNYLDELKHKNIFIATVRYK